MPSRPKKPCNYPGCKELVNKGYCDKHKKQGRGYDDNRMTSAQRGYGYKWQKYRAMFIKDNPICVTCLADGVVEVATVVDHIKPHRGDYDLFWDTANHQALCKRCHDAKTGRGE